MAVDTRVHITSDVLQDRAVLRRVTTLRWVPKVGCRPTRCLYVQGHAGDKVCLSLAELGEALRALKIRPADLGYTAPKPRKAAT